MALLLDKFNRLDPAERLQALPRNGDPVDTWSKQNDGPDLWDLVEPGVLTILHLSGRRIGKQDVLPLCVSLLAAMSEPSPKHGPMQRVFVLDEINRFASGSPLCSGCVARRSSTARGNG